jgi:spore coat polysaccharide biosynthesis protein SpsF (cytidylyltransferase family)
MPDGMNAEVIDAKALEEAYPKMTTEEKEHVTLHFERNPYIFDNRKLDLKHMSVDTVNDLNRLKEIAKYDI